MRCEFDRPLLKKLRKQRRKKRDKMVKSVLEICYLGRYVRDRERENEQIKCVAETKLEEEANKQMGVETFCLAVLSVFFIRPFTFHFRYMYLFFTNQPISTRF